MHLPHLAAEYQGHAKVERGLVAASQGTARRVIAPKRACTLEDSRGTSSLQHFALLSLHTSMHLQVRSVTLRTTLPYITCPQLPALDLLPGRLSTGRALLLRACLLALCLRACACVLVLALPVHACFAYKHRLTVLDCTFPY